MRGVRLARVEANVITVIPHNVNMHRARLHTAILFCSPYKTLLFCAVLSMFWEINGVTPFYENIRCRRVCVRDFKETHLRVRGERKQ